MVVLLGDIVKEAFVLPSDQEYVPRPLAVNVVLSPKQITASVPASDTGGIVSIGTVIEVAAEHPLASVTVTKYSSPVFTINVWFVLPPVHK